MIKQVQWSENQAAPQQIPDINLEAGPSQIELVENQGMPQPAEGIEAESQQQSANVSRNVVESVGAIPNELYERLGLTMPRWLLGMLTVVLGVILSGLLVSTLALWTPLWSNLDRTDEELGVSGKDEQKMPLPGELWSKISQYQLSKPMNILIMGIEPVSGAVDGSPESFSGKSDTMLMARLDPSDKTMRVLSIPRD
ncbi:MAG TPA: hypothetical protein V6D26_05820, partial [Stenomitos sp.]